MGSVMRQSARRASVVNVMRHGAVPVLAVAGVQGMQGVQGLMPRAGEPDLRLRHRPGGAGHRGRDRTPDREQHGKKDQDGDAQRSHGRQLSGRSPRPLQPLLTSPIED